MLWILFISEISDNISEKCKDYDQYFLLEIFWLKIEFSHQNIQSIQLLWYIMDIHFDLDRLYVYSLLGHFALQGSFDASR